MRVLRERSAPRLLGRLLKVAWFQRGKRVVGFTGCGVMCEAHTAAIKRLHDIFSQPQTTGRRPPGIPETPMSKRYDKRRENLEIDRDPFEKNEPREALVQCWICNLAENRSYGIGRPSEVRCSACNGRVEVLTVDGKLV